MNPRKHMNSYPNVALLLARKLNVSPFIITYLEGLGLTKESDLVDFLYPQLANLPSPFDMKNMEEASSFLANWIKEEKTVVIWGDYDADGVTGTALLVDFFRGIGVATSYYIPNRLTEGYGMNVAGIEEIAASSSPEKTLIITVDCGISNHGEIAKARELGFEVIVTDHHEIPGGGLPDCLILNGKQNGCNFKGHHLAGVGVAFFLAVATRKKLQALSYFTSKNPVPNLKKYLSYVAIGTIADMVELKSANRTLVKAGFEALVDNDQLSKGFQLLLEENGMEDGIHSSDEVAFKIAPLINAAGRMGESSLVVELLVCSDYEKARKAINTIVQLNKKRKKICIEDLEYALTNCNTAMTEGGKPLVLMGAFHRGIIGITASRLVEKFGVPAIVFSEETDRVTGEAVLKGSCRSIEGVDILGGLVASSKYIEKFGGHKMAAGLTILKRNFANFKEVFSQDILTQYTKRTARRKAANIQASLDVVFEKKMLSSLALLEPHGAGNPKPIFEDSEAKVVHSKQVGSEGDHLKLVFRGRLKNHRGIGFGLGEKKSELFNQEATKVTYTPVLNKFNKVESWEVMVLDIAY